MMAYSSLPLRTGLSLFPFKTPILSNWLADAALLLSMLFSLKRDVCDSYDYCSHHLG